MASQLVLLSKRVSNRAGFPFGQDGNSSPTVSIARHAVGTARAFQVLGPSQGMSLVVSVSDPQVTSAICTCWCPN